jgi:hypothetical protein
MRVKRIQKIKVEIMFKSNPIEKQLKVKLKNYSGNE